MSLNEGGGHNVFAIVETGGKQYKIQEGDLIKVEKINAEIGAVTVLDKVLAVGQDNGQVLIGTPVVSGAKVVIIQFCSFSAPEGTRCLRTCR